ncbi:MAG: ATP-binding protein [Candidatus Heimdallarchaeota archaeon]|nr:ATP-binding protein [Candidatus Heimdallarchaeota archaeon]
MITEQDLAATNISMKYDLSPSKSMIGDISGLLGNFSSELISAFYPKNISKKANIVITELFNNAVENNIDRNSKIVLELKIDKDYLWIRVKNNARRLQYKKVKAHVKKINTTKNLKKLMTDTIRERRKDRLKGGLGLIRLVAENKFDLSVHYRVHFLIVETRIALGGLN